MDFSTLTSQYRFAEAFVPFLRVSSELFVIENIGNNGNVTLATRVRWYLASLLLIDCLISTSDLWTTGLFAYQ
jgi:hypothetical protein